MHVAATQLPGRGDKANAGYLHARGRCSRHRRRGYASARPHPRERTPCSWRRATSGNARPSDGRGPISRPTSWPRDPRRPSSPWATWPTATDRAAEFTNCYGPTWGRFSDRTRSAPGNHEYKTADAEGYFGFWERQAQQARPDGHSYYSFELGDWHLVALDSSIDVSAGSAQARWLRSDLAGSTARCKLAFSHHPRFSSGWHGDALEMGAIFQILYDGRVSVVLAGHDHDYERFAPLNPSGEVEPGRGVRSFVVGTGGAPLRAFGTPRRGSEARNADAKGVLQLVLRADGYDWTFLPVAGASYSDSGSGTCVPAAEFDPLQYIASHDDLIRADRSRRSRRRAALVDLRTGRGPQSRRLQ